MTFLTADQTRPGPRVQPFTTQIQQPAGSDLIDVIYCDTMSGVASALCRIKQRPIFEVLSPNILNARTSECFVLVLIYSGAHTLKQLQ